MSKISETSETNSVKNDLFIHASLSVAPLKTHSNRFFCSMPETRFRYLASVITRHASACGSTLHDNTVSTRKYFPVALNEGDHVSDGISNLPNAWRFDAGNVTQRCQVQERRWLRTQKHLKNNITLPGLTRPNCLITWTLSVRLQGQLP